MKKATVIKTILSAAMCLWLGSVSPAQAGAVSDSLKEGDLQTLQGKELVPYDTSNLEKTSLFAIYFSAEWCPPCRAFTPELVQFYNKVKNNHPEFELVFCSRDKSPEEMVNYMAGTKMPWPAIDYSKRSLLKKYAGRGIPCLVVIDADGNVLMHSYEGENYVGPRKVLADLSKRLSAEQASKKNAGTDFEALFKRKPGQPN